MSFQFIDNSVVDCDARKRIRSHVMKGKNTGKTRPPKTRAPSKPSSGFASAASMSAVPDINPVSYWHPAATKTVTTTASASSTAKDGLGRAAKASVAVAPKCDGAVPRLLCHELRMTSLSGKLSPKALGLINQFIASIDEVMYPAEFCQASSGPKKNWLHYVCTDEAFFHGTVAMAAIRSNMADENRGTGPVVAYHLSALFRHVTNRIAEGKALSDSTFGTVVCMVILERHLDNQRQGQIHFDGLQRMIALRGGLSKLMPNLMLTQKILRTDLDVAVNRGSYPVIDIQDIPGTDLLAQTREAFLRDNDSKTADASLALLPATTSDAFRDIFTDVLSWTHRLNGSLAAGRRLRPDDFQAILIRVGYRVVGFSALAAPRPASPLDDLLHLACTALLSAYWLQCGSKDVNFALLRSQLRAALQDVAENQQHQDREHYSPELAFWALYVARISVYTIDDEEQPEGGSGWILPLVRSLARDSGLRCWADARALLGKLPWVQCQHGKLGQELWDRAWRAEAAEASEQQHQDAREPR